LVGWLIGWLVGSSGHRSFQCYNSVLLIYTHSLTQTSACADIWWRLVVGKMKEPKYLLVPTG